MHRLWSPWRSQYVTGEKKDDCIFCQKPREKKDEANYILLRGDTCFVMLNIFPYNNGHLMIAPYRHISSVEKMRTEENGEVMQFIQRMMKVLRETMNPDGFNIGANVGQAAGAGIADHVHFHIVPRWVGDYNFMPLMSETKVIPEALSDTYKKLKGKL